MCKTYMITYKKTEDSPQVYLGISDGDNIDDAVETIISEKQDIIDREQPENFLVYELKFEAPKTVPVKDTQTFLC